MPAETRAADDDTIIGIDLGTTNSEVAIVSGGALDRGGGRRGYPAVVRGTRRRWRGPRRPPSRNQAVAAPERTVLSVKRLMARAALDRGDRAEARACGDRALRAASVTRIPDCAGAGRPGGSRLSGGDSAVAGGSCRFRSGRASVGMFRRARFWQCQRDCICK